MPDLFYLALGKFVATVIPLAIFAWVAIHLFEFGLDLIVGYRVRLVSPREQELIEQNRKELAEYKAGEPEVEGD